MAKTLEAYRTPVTRGALKLAMLTGMRPGIVTSARWNEIELDAAEWHVPGSRVKTGMRTSSRLPPRRSVYFDKCLLTPMARTMYFSRGLDRVDLASIVTL